MSGTAFVPSWRLDRSPVDYTIEGVIPEVGVGIVYAASTAGKSLVVTKMALDLVNGVPFFGHQAVKGDVVMALGEGMADAGIRLEALVADSYKEEPADVCEGNCTGKVCNCTKATFLSEEGLFYYTKPFAVWDDAQRRTFINQVKATGDNLKLIVFDTLTLFARGKSLEYPTPASVVMAALKEIAAELGVFVLAVHHTTKKGDQFRGAQVLFDESDVVIRIEEGVISNEKQKTGGLFAPIDFEIEVVEWIDEETGKTVRTALAVEAQEHEAPLRTAPQQEQRPLPKIKRVDQAGGKRTGVRDKQYSKGQYRAAGIASILGLWLLWGLGMIGHH